MLAPALCADIALQIGHYYLMQLQSPIEDQALDLALSLEVASRCRLRQLDFSRLHPQQNANKGL
jgi:hypothetical protein